MAVRITKFVVMLALICHSKMVLSNITNADFSNGLMGWQGEVADINLTIQQSSNLVGDLPNNFAATNGVATLTTSTASEGNFAVFIYQTFDLPNISDHQMLQLTFEAQLERSNITLGDSFFGQVNYGENFDQVISLVSNRSADLTRLAGQTVELMFGLEDLDDIQDQVRISNLRLSINDRNFDDDEIPIPIGALIALSALLMWIGSRFSKKPSLKHT